MYACEFYQEQISRMMDGDLSEAEQSELLSHLKQCERCRSVYTAFSTISSQLAKPDRSSIDLSSKIMRQIQSETIPKSAQRQNRRRRFSPLRIAALAAGLLLVLLVGSRFPSWNSSSSDTAKEEITTESSNQSMTSAESSNENKSSSSLTDNAEQKTGDTNDISKAESEQASQLAPADQLSNALSDFYATSTEDSEAANWMTALMQLCPYASVSMIDSPEIYQSVPDLDMQVVSDQGTACHIRLWQIDKIWTFSVALYSDCFEMQIGRTDAEEITPSAYTWILNYLSE